MWLSWSIFSCGSQLVCRLTVSSLQGQEEVVTTDAVVFAVGVKAMQGIVSSSPDLGASPVGTHLPTFCHPTL